MTTTTARPSSGGRDLMELNGWSSPQMQTWYRAVAPARRSYDCIMNDRPDRSCLRSQVAS